MNLYKMITLLAPFAPYIAEEIWEEMGNKKSIFETSHWPEYDPDIIQELEIEIAIQINGKTRNTILITVNDSEYEVIRKVKTSEQIKSYLDGKTIIKVFYIPQKVINFIVK